MPAIYRLIQLHPDPIAEERINVGVCVSDLDGTNANAQFLKRWKRVALFAGSDIQFLIDYAERFQQDCWSGRINLLELNSSPMSSIQITEQRGSLDEPAELLKSIAATYLKESADVERLINLSRAMQQHYRVQLATSQSDSLKIILTDFEAVWNKINPPEIYQETK